LYWGLINKDKEGKKRDWPKINVVAKLTLYRVTLYRGCTVFNHFLKNINIVYFINWILVKLLFAMSNWFIWIKTLFCLLVKRVNVCIDSKHVKISNFLNFISWKPLADDMRRPLDKANKMSLVLKDINDLTLISRLIISTILSSSLPLKFFLTESRRVFETWNLHNTRFTLGRAIQIEPISLGVFVTD
jgi:hypothetical protein